MSYTDLGRLVLLAALWGGSFLFMRIAAPEFGALPMAFIRCAIAALFLLPIVYWRGVDPHWRHHWQAIALVGVLNTAIPFAFYGFASLHLGAGSLSVVNATTPMFSALIAWLWLQERLSYGAMVGVMLGFVGVTVLSGGSEGDTQATWLALLAGLGATCMYGIGGCYTRKYLRGVRPLTVATGSLISASLAVMPLALWQWPEGEVQALHWWAMAGLGILSTGIGYILYYGLINSAGVNKAVSVTYLIPLFGIFWGAMLLEEQLSANLLIGGSLILLGIALTTGLLTRLLFWRRVNA